MIINTQAGSAGLKPTIVVTAPTGSTVTCDGVQGTEVSGTWTFEVEIGTHTIVASNSVSSKTVLVVVDATAKYTVNVGNLLPSAYQELSYIESTGTQYINPNVTMSKNIIAQLGIAVTSLTASSGDYFLFGGWDDPFAVKFISSNVVSIYGSWSTSHAFSLSDYNFHDFQYGKTTSLDLDSYTFSDSSSTSQFPAYLFCVYAGGGPNYYCSAKLSYCRIYNSSTLVRNFIPCYRKSDGEVGLYDLVTSTFYTNQGTGTFRIGGIVDDTFTSTYQQVEYIESSGTQYLILDIGDTITTTDAFELQASMNQTSSKSCSPFGWDDRTAYFFDIHMSHQGASGICELAWGAENTVYTSYVLSIDTPHVMEMSSAGQFSIDGTVIGSLTPQTYTDSSEKFGLFGRLHDQSLITDFGFIGKIYSFKYNRAGALLRNLIPCYRKSDSVAGLYDMVNGGFYTNQGTGTFTVGGDVD